MTLVQSTVDDRRHGILPLKAGMTSDGLAQLIL